MLEGGSEFASGPSHITSICSMGFCTSCCVARLFLRGLTAVGSSDLSNLCVLVEAPRSFRRISPMIAFDMVLHPLG